MATPQPRVSLTFDTLIDALDRDGRLMTTRGSQAMARCPLPGHSNDDQHPGLSITEHDDRVLIYCHGLHGRCFSDILDQYGFEHDDESLREPTRMELLETYDYIDTEGHVTYRILRLWDNEANDKTFRPERPGPDGAISNLDGITRVPYNLPAILEATKADKPIVLVEGEKDVNTLNAYGITATTVANGQNGWGAGDYAKWFVDATVIIVPDNGAFGFGIDAAKDLRHVAKTHLLKLPEDIGPKGDSTDFIIKHTIEEYRNLLNEAPEYTPEMARIDPTLTESSTIASKASVKATDEKVTVEWFEEQLRIEFYGFLYLGSKITAMIDVWYAAHGQVMSGGRTDLNSNTQHDRLSTVLNRYTAGKKNSYHQHIDYAFSVARNYIDSPNQGMSLMAEPLDDMLQYDWMIEGFIPGGKGEEGAVMLVADGGIGKSNLALGIAVSIASGKWVFGNLNVHIVGKVLFLDWEGSAKKHRRRLGRILAGAHIKEEEIGDNIHYIRETSPLVAIVRMIRTMIRELGIVLVIIDSFRGAAKGTLKDDDTAETFFNAVNSLGIPVLVIHHFNREDKTYGSAFIRNFARFMWEIPTANYIKKDVEAKTAIKILSMECTKDNEGSMEGQTMGMKIEWAIPEIYMTPVSGRYAALVAKNPDRRPPLTADLLELLEAETRWMTLDAIYASVYPESKDPRRDRKKVSDTLNDMERTHQIQIEGERQGRKFAARGTPRGSDPWR